MAVTVTRNVPTVTYTGDGADDVIRLFSEPAFTTYIARGNGGADEIIGSSEDERLFGGGGNDRVFGGPGGVDRLSGGPGRDFIESTSNGDGDALIGGRGQDTLNFLLSSIAGNSGNVVINGGAQADIFAFGAGDTALHDTPAYVNAGAGTFGYLDEDGNQVRVGTLTGIEVVLFQDYNATHFIGSAGEDFVLGVGDSALSGAGGDDILLTSDGDNSLIGGGGNDVLSFIGSGGNTRTTGTQFANGGFGKDVIVTGTGQAEIDLRGGAGEDVFIALAGDGTLSGGGGDDAFFFRLPSAEEPFPAGLLSKAALAVFDEKAAASIIPRDFSDMTILGGKGSDTLYFEHLEREGSGSADPGVTVDLSANTGTLDPRGGGFPFAVRKVENVVATNHTDTLTGNGARNTFEGLKGDDTLTLGGGRDTVVHSRGDGFDYVTDFTPRGRASDVIDLTDYDFRFRRLDFDRVLVGDTDPVTGEVAQASGTWVMLNKTNGIFLEDVISSQLGKEDFLF